MFFESVRWSPNQKMLVAQATGVRSPVKVMSVPVPEIGPEDALVRIQASGICRSDWHIWNGDWGWFGVVMPEGGVLGHEIGGVVEKVGSRVTTIKVGQRVTVPFHLACGKCPSCQRGHMNRCDDGASTNGTNGSGGWAEYMRVPGADLNCIPLPNEVSTLTAAALGCRYMTGWHAVHDQGALLGGETAAIFGCGGVGMAAIEVAVCLGGDVIAVDVDDAKLAQARQLGARATINAKGLSSEQVGQAVKDLTVAGAGADMTVDALGLQHTVLAGVYSLRKGGRLAQVGLTSQAEKGMASVPVDQIVSRELRIVGSVGNPHWGYQQLLTLVAQGRLRPERLISKEIKLSEVEAILHDMDTFKTTGYVVITDFAN